MRDFVITIRRIGKPIFIYSVPGVSSAAVAMDAIDEFGVCSVSVRTA